MAQAVQSLFPQAKLAIGPSTDTGFYYDFDIEGHSFTEEDLVKIISQVEATGGKIIIPAFSLGRTQEIIYILHKLFDGKKVPKIPVYIDSPLTANITEIFRENTDWFDAEFYKTSAKRATHLLMRTTFFIPAQQKNQSHLMKNRARL
jgi:Cft2 family RNA processing exonuclease